MCVCVCVCVCQLDECNSDYFLRIGEVILGQ